MDNDVALRLGRQQRLMLRFAIRHARVFTFDCMLKVGEIRTCLTSSGCAMPTDLRVNRPYTFF